MEIRVLGSGGWEGIPAPFCSCIICTQANAKQFDVNFRTRPEFFVETNKGNFLLEISPDIRLQAARFRLPLVRDFVVSHWHFDHLYGLLELGAWSQLIMEGNINIYCSEKTKVWLDKNFAHVPKNIVTVSPLKSFVLKGVRITPLPVSHMHHEDGKLNEGSLKNTFGYLLEHAGNKIAYLSDYYHVGKGVLEKIRNCDAVIADGTYLFEENFPHKKEQLGEKSDPDHIHGSNIFDFVKKIRAKKTFFHSITHLSEKSHEEMQKMLPNKMYLTYDGMRIL